MLDKGFLYLLFLLLLCVACQNVNLDEVDPEISVPQSEYTTGNLTLHVSQLQQQTFSPDANDIDANCTHLCFAVYDMGGTRLKQVNQKLGDNDYGTVNLQLDKGTYQVVVLAHSSDRNPTMTNLSKIQFTNAYGYTDTFLYYTKLTVTDQPQTLNLNLNRIVSMCRFVICDPIPDGVTQMKFVYKGGSGHFSAITGLGVTKSTQTITIPVEAGKKYTEFDLYTFLHNEKGQIDLTATALTASGEEYCAWEFQIPMAKNQITRLIGHFFEDADESESWTLIPNMYFESIWNADDYYIY